MSELVDCINNLSAKDIIKSIAKTANGTPFYLQTTGAGGFCAAFQVVRDAYVGTIPDVIQLAAQNTMVCTLVDAGLWAKLDIFYVMANGDSPNCDLNWKNPGTFTLNPIHFPLFTPWEGYTGDGNGSGAGNDYIDTGWDPNTNGVNYKLNDASYGVYIRNNTLDDGYAIGAESAAGNRFLFRPRSAGNALLAWINASLSSGYANVSGSGFWIINRTASNATEIWQNKISRNTDIDPSFSLSTRDIKLLVWDDEGVLKNWALSQESVFYAGASLIQAEVNILTDAVEAYMVSNGKGVA